MTGGGNSVQKINDMSQSSIQSNSISSNNEEDDLSEDESEVEIVRQNNSKGTSFEEYEIQSLDEKQYNIST